MFLIDQRSKEEIKSKDNKEDFTLTQCNSKKKVLKIIQKEYDVKDPLEPKAKRQKIEKVEEFDEEDQSSNSPKVVKKLILKANIPKEEGKI